MFICVTGMRTAAQFTCLTIAAELVTGCRLHTLPWIALLSQWRPICESAAFLVPRLGWGLVELWGDVWCWHLRHWNEWSTPGQATRSILPPERGKKWKMEVSARSTSTSLVISRHQCEVKYSGFHFLRKTLLDFIKSCGGRIDLKFSGVALLSLLYSPIWKRKLFGKGKIPESCSVKEIYRWKEDCFVHFMKKLEGLGNLPFQEKIKQKWADNWRWRFSPRRPPGTGPERVMCTNCRRSPWPHLSRTWSRRRWSLHWVHRALNRGDSVKSIERDGRIRSWSSWLRADATQCSSPTYHR